MLLCLCVVKVQFEMDVIKNCDGFGFSCLQTDICPLRGSSTPWRTSSLLRLNQYSDTGVPASIPFFKLVVLALNVSWMEGLHVSVCRAGCPDAACWYWKLDLREVTSGEKDRKKAHSEDIKLSNKMWFRPSGPPRGPKQTQNYEKCNESPSL